MTQMRCLFDFSNYPNLIETTGTMNASLPQLCTLFTSINFTHYVSCRDSGANEGRVDRIWF